MSPPNSLSAALAGLLLAAALGAAQAQAPEQPQPQAQAQAPEQPQPQAQAQAQPIAQAPDQAQERVANDPFEGWNRAIFGINQGLDNVLVKPVATGYRAVVPELMRTGVSNFFGNFRDGWSAINALLQAKPVVAAQMATRVATNTLFGVGGLFDVASELGIARQREDFGQTLGRWCIPAGPYLVWPLLGPSSLRDSVALPLDLSWATGKLTNDGTARIGLTVLEYVDIRTSLLDADRMIEAIAIDKYVFIRDAYLTRRRSLVFDGEPPESPDECKFWPSAAAQ
jgi:phospholipid-binding lipoprotein MlaA